MHTKSDNIEIIMGSEINDIIEEICESLLQKYEEGLEESMRKSEFIFYSVDLFIILSTAKNKPQQEWIIIYGFYNKSYK